VAEPAYSDERRIIARLIREARERVGLHQSVLAERINKTQSYISKIEGSHQGVDVLVLLDIAQALDIDSIDLFALMSSEILRTRSRQ
jgi:transcriptional regulator with XRE-family HTH domain